MAGHSQFKNIMHRKGKQDAVRSKLFGKLAKEITVAAKMGLPTGPKVGLELRKHIQSHTDTYVVGPMTAAQMLDALK